MKTAFGRVIRMPAVITVVADVGRPLGMMRKLMRRTANMRPVLMGPVAEIVKGGIERNFARKAAPGFTHGTPVQRWEDLHEPTVRIRKERGTWKGPRVSILDETGTLRKSFARRGAVQPLSVSVVCNDTRPSDDGEFPTLAQMHQWGGKERSNETPDGYTDIPERPFMYIDLNRIQSITRAIAGFLLQGLIKGPMRFSRGGTLKY